VSNSSNKITKEIFNSVYSLSFRSFNFDSPPTRVTQSGVSMNIVWQANSETSGSKLTSCLTYH